MRISTSMIYEGGTAKVQRATTDLLKTQQQLASGKRDPDPISAARVLLLNQAESLNAQYRRNQDTAEDALRLMDSSLGAVIKTLQDVRETTLQGVNATLSPSDRQLMANTLRGQLDALIALGNTKDSRGAFLFSGFQSATQPFSGSSTTSVSYGGDEGQVSIQLSATDQIPISITGQEIFMNIQSTTNGKQSVFSTLSSIINVIESGGPDLANAASNYMADLDVGIDNVINTQSRIGGHINQVEAFRVFSENRSIENKKTLSSLQDIDYAEAISTMAKQQNILDAAQKSFVKIMSMSLFSKL